MEWKGQVRYTDRYEHSYCVKKEEKNVPLVVLIWKKKEKKSKRKKNEKNKNIKKWEWKILRIYE